MTDSGPTLVNGQIIGYLAVHESLGDDDRWTVTHTGSGLAVCSRLTKNAALDLIQELNEKFAKIFSLDNIDMDMESVRKIYGDEVVDDIRFSVSKARRKVY